MGVSLRTNYRDARPGATDEAALFTQTDADFAQLERLELLRRQAGGDVGLEEDLEEVRR
jgi:hypothetical protein